MILRQAIGTILVMLSMSMHASQSSNNEVPLTQPDPVFEQSWLDSFGDMVAESLGFLDQNIELVQLAQSLAHLPYIITVDSTDHKVIRGTAIASGSSIGLKVIYELARMRPEQRFGLVRALLLDVPKLCLLLVSMGYDVIRFLDASKVAVRNKSEGHKLGGFKINQCALLFVEIFLRTVAFVLQKQVRDGYGGTAMASIAGDVADGIMLWRLLSRYLTLFTYNKSFSFGITFDRVEDDISADEESDEQFSEQALKVVGAFAQGEKESDTKSG